MRPDPEVVVGPQMSAAGIDIDLVHSPALQPWSEYCLQSSFAAVVLVVVVARAVVGREC